MTVVCVVCICFLTFTLLQKYIQASPIGQAVFERLLKACGEVEWKGDTTSILVLKQIQVDAPYEPINCTIVQTNSNANKKNSAMPPPSRSASNNNGGTDGSSGQTLEEVSLERVKKIVASSMSATTNVEAVDRTIDATATNTATATSS